MSFGLRQDDLHLSLVWQRADTRVSTMWDEEILRIYKNFAVFIILLNFCFGVYEVVVVLLNRNHAEHVR